MGKKNKKCWIDDTNALFIDYTIIPQTEMTLASRINCITRLICFIAIMLLIFQILNCELIIIYFLTAILIIIMVYHKEKEKMVNNNNYNSCSSSIYENFEITYTPPPPSNPKPSLDCSTQKARINYNCTKPDENTYQVHSLKKEENSSFYKMKNNYNSAEYNTNFATKTDNQSLVGCANPKTLIAPIIAPPLAALEIWKNDGNYKTSKINETRNTYPKESGYEVDQGAYCKTNYKTPQPYYCAQKKNKPATSYNKINEKQPNVLPPKQGVSVPPPAAAVEAFQFPYEINAPKQEMNNSDNLFHKGFKNNPMFYGKYNENVFTQTISPGEYKINTRNEPINSNMGITLAEQNEEPNYEMIEPFENVNTSNVYDPRFYGYGTSYRGYVDKTVGQPRFYYDDVDAIRMPNYITRNKIDVMPFGDAYGPDNDGGNKYHSNITALADQHYLDSSLQFRTEMQDRLMRKINSNQWQQRMFPINTNGQRMAK